MITPLPIHESCTQSPSSVYVLMMYSIKANGFWVSWIEDVWVSRGNTWTLLGYRSVLPPPDNSVLHGLYTLVLFCVCELPHAYTWGFLFITISILFLSKLISQIFSILADSILYTFLETGLCRPCLHQCG